MKSLLQELLVGNNRRVNINVQDQNGMSGLHQATLSGNVEVMKVLLDNGAAVDIRDKRGMRSLHYAAWCGRPDPVSLLLEYGSSANDPADCDLRLTPLHLACQYGHVQVTNFLLYYEASPIAKNRKQRTPLDNACEFGHTQIVDMLLKTDKCKSLLEPSTDEMMSNDRTTCLHLAAKNAHNSIIKLLLEAGCPINRTTMTGTALHEAAINGQFSTVNFLLECGIDVNRTNSCDQTALDVVQKQSSCPAAKEIKAVIKEAISAVQAKAVRDHNDSNDPDALNFVEGEIITVLEQGIDARWRGIIFSDNHTSRRGYFPATAVILLDRPVGGMHHSSNCAPLKTATIKKVSPPVVPDVSNTTSRLSVSSYSSGYGSQSATSSTDRNSFGSIGPDEVLPPPPSPHTINASSQQVPPSPTRVTCDRGHLYAGRIPQSISSLSPQNQQSFAYPPQYQVNKKQNGSPCSPLDFELVKSGHAYHGGNYTQLHFAQNHYQNSLEDQGIDMTQSPGRDSPGSSTGSTISSGGSGIASGGGSSSACRNSTSSLDSGRASVFDGKLIQNRLSGQSYESSSSASSSSGGICNVGIRQSYHSSSSSLGSMDKLEEGTTYHSSSHGQAINVVNMMMHGFEDSEILTTWLSNLNFEEYIGLFQQAGYDMPTISRMTPEDLVAIGITRPGHRKKLKSEIMKLNIPDGLPDYKPDTVEEWLRLLRLEQYNEALAQQGYSSVDHMTSVAWEDLEDIGIKLLGHQKKMMLAIKRIKDINAGKSLDRHRHNAELTIGSSASLPRPSSANVMADLQYPYGYRTEQIVVSSLHQALPIVGQSDNQFTPEFKTFQQSPTQLEMCYRPQDVDSKFSSSKGMNQCSVFPNRRSIEALNVMDFNNHNQQYHQDGRWYDHLHRRNSFDTGADGEITPTNDPDYPMIGSNSLPRPKVLVKPRPVAKIMAKTRQLSSESLSTTYSYDHDIEITKQQLLSNPGDHSINNSSKIYSTCGWKDGGNGKKVPPAPPKRTNSVKSDSSDKNSDQEFATRVKSLTSSFNMNKACDDKPSSPTPSDDLPPPPAPLLSTQYYSCTISSSKPSTAQGLFELKQRLETIHNKSPVRRISQSESVNQDYTTGSMRRRESSQNRLRNDESSSSSDSNISTSSTDSASMMPFANDNIGTIKQRMAKGPVLSTLEDIRNRSPPSLSPTSSPSSTLRKPSLISKLGQDNGNRLRDSLCSDRTSSGSEISSENLELSKKRDLDTGNVLNDIDNMLADLNEELSAMLESDHKQQ